MEIVTDGVLPNIEDAPFDENPGDIFIAIDLGTTTVVALAWQVSTKKILATSFEPNAQRKYGADVMSRIEQALCGKADLEKKIIQTQLSRLCAKVVFAASEKIPRPFRATVLSVCITGNSTMLSLLLGLSVKGLSALPFSLPSRFGFWTSWGECFFEESSISKKTPVYFPPAIGAFVGADTVCAMISAGFDLSSQKSFLLSDVGTNSELALFIPNKDGGEGRIICTSCAAGPAFEAANISCGMAGENGAIDNFFVSSNGKIEFHVLGGGEARGVCGSGLVSAVASLLDAHKISKDGMIFGEGSSVLLAPSVFLLQSDIRALQLAKSAVKTGLDFLLKKTIELPTFFLAGGFGSKINVACAKKIALFPKNLSPISIGNAALFGASAILFSQKLQSLSEKIAKKSIFVNLASYPKFQEDFLKNCSFE